MREIKLKPLNNALFLYNTHKLVQSNNIMLQPIQTVRPARDIPPP